MDMEAEQLAQIGHEAVKAAGIKKTSHWEKLSDVERKSLISIVGDAEVKTAKAAHEHWLKSYEGAGWQAGEKFSGRAKKHPDMVEFKKLGPETKDKFKLFLKVVKAASNV